jgi:hypothetical protein
MKKYFLLVSICMGLGCAKEEKKIQDVPPQFNISSTDFKVAGTETEIQLKRGDLDNGPLMEVSIDDSQRIQKSEKSLTCSGYTIQGRPTGKGDPTTLVFKFSDKEFPGLNTLPTNANCNLSIKLENSNGSVAKKSIPVKLHFDFSQQLEVSRTIAPNQSIAASENGYFLIEQTTVKNPLNYPVGISYQSDFGCNVIAAVVSPNNMRIGPFQSMNPPYFTKISKIDVTGIYNKFEGNYSSFVSFTIPPKESVSISGYGLVKSNEPITMGADVRFYGASIQQCSNPYENPSLHLWNDMERSVQDIKQPIKYHFQPGSIK